MNATPSHVIGLLIQNPPDERLLREFISSLGYTAVPLHSPLTSPADLDQLDLLVVDHVNAGRHGTMLLRHKARAENAMLPLLVALPQHLSSAPWLQAGFDDVLRLPLTKAELAVRLKVFLRLREQSEARYRAIFDRTAVGLYRMTVDGHIVLANAALLAASGYDTLEELRAQDMPTIRTIVEPARPDTLQALEPDVEVVETVWVRPDGERRFFRERVRAIRDDENAVLYYNGAIEDITAWRNAEQEIHFQSRLLDTVQQAVIVTNLDGTIRYWNRFAETIYGWSAAEVIGGNILDVTVPDMAREQAADLMEKLAAGQSWSGEFQVRRRDDTTFWAQVTDSPVYDERGVMIGIIGVSTDITERRNLQAQLLQAHKMDSIGRLAGGIAHDFNNILTAITGNAELALQHPLIDAELDHDLRSILHAAGRAAGLTRQLLAFARKEVVAPRVLNLNAVLAGIESLLRRLIREDVELTLRLAPDLGHVKVDPTQIEQVIFNLVVNARDAMPSGGRLTIDTSNATLDTDYTRRYLGVGPGEYILLAVTDTGSGMPPEVLAHVFEPFFTTKTVGKGTGLGLSTCYGIVTQSGGYILPYSEVGRGTTFKVYLPRVDAASDADGDERATNVLPRGSETVLVVEDEAMLREFVRRVLAGQGYTVLEAADGEEALRVLGQEPPGSVALVVTDMVMPKLGGAALAQRVARAAPATRIVLMSGYMDSVMGGDEALPPGTFFLQKPFSAIALAQKVRMALDQLGGAD